MKVLAEVRSGTSFATYELIEPYVITDLPGGLVVHVNLVVHEQLVEVQAGKNINLDY